MITANNEAIDAGVSVLAGYGCHIRNRAGDVLMDAETRQIVRYLIEAAAVHLTDAGQPAYVTGHPPISEGNVAAFWKAYAPLMDLDPGISPTSAFQGAVRAGLEAVQFALLDTPAARTDCMIDGQWLVDRLDQIDAALNDIRGDVHILGYPVDPAAFVHLNQRLDGLVDVVIRSDQRITEKIANVDIRVDAAYQRGMRESHRLGIGSVYRRLDGIQLTLNSIVESSGQQVLGEVVHADVGPTYYEVWSDALALAVDELRGTTYGDQGLLNRALWFRDQLKRPIRDAPGSGTEWDDDDEDEEFPDADQLKQHEDEDHPPDPVDEADAHDQAELTAGEDD